MTFIRENSFGGNSSYRYKIDENLNSDVDQSYNVIFNVYRLPRNIKFTYTNFYFTFNVTFKLSYLYFPSIFRNRHVPYENVNNDRKPSHFTTMKLSGLAMAWTELFKCISPTCTLNF